jgi:hypothetical protein
MFSMRSPPSHRLQPRLNPGGAIQDPKSASRLFQLPRRYTVKLNGAKKTMALNKHSFMAFEKSFGPKKGKQPFAKLNGVDASSIPPYENVTQQNIHRSNFVAMKWHSACNKTVPNDPQKGWELVDSSYQPAWFTGPQMPDGVILSESDLDNDDDDETRSIDPDSDTDFSDSDAENSNDDDCE